MCEKKLMLTAYRTYRMYNLHTVNKRDFSPSPRTPRPFAHSDPDRQAPDLALSPDPQHEDDYLDNLAGLLEEIDAVHERVGQALKPYRGQSFYVFHPAFGYFGAAYGLKQQAVEVGGRYVCATG